MAFLWISPFCLPNAKPLPELTEDVCTTYRKALDKLETLRALLHCTLILKGILRKKESRKTLDKTPYRAKVKSIYQSRILP